MSKDEAKGKLKKEEGNARVGAGKVTGNTGQIIKGEAQKVKGKNPRRHRQSQKKL